MTDDELKAEIERRCPGADAENFGRFWRVVLPCRKHVGVRADPLSLLDDLLAERDRIAPAPSVSDAERGAPPEPYPEPEAPTVIENPETQERLAEALNEKAELKAALEEALGKLEARKTRVDEFPEELLDLVRENEPHADALSRLRGDYVQLTNRLVDTRLPALSNLERAYQNRLQKALYSERKGAVEITD